jgi:hypothetical protein
MASVRNGLEKRKMGKGKDTKAQIVLNVHSPKLLTKEVWMKVSLWKAQTASHH